MVKSFAIILSFISILSWTIVALDEIYFEGLRLDFSAFTMNRDILAAIVPAMNRTKNHKFASLHERGSFGSSLYIKNIKIEKGVINEDRLDMMNYSYSYPIYILNGSYEAIYFSLSFHYTMSWIGFPLASGVGSAIISNVENDILVLFNETEPDVKIPKPWDIMSVTLPWSIFSATNWVTSLLHKNFVTEFDKVLDDAMYDFAHRLLKNYTYIEDSFPHDIDLVFNNTIYEVKPTNYYFSIGFATKIIVNKTSTRRVMRKQLAQISPQGNFAYCLSAQLIPDTIDLLGKNGYYNEVLNEKHWGYNSNHVKELYELLPKLREETNPDDIFEIICETSSMEPVNDLGGRNNQNRLHYIYP